MSFITRNKIWKAISIAGKKKEEKNTLLPKSHFTGHNIIQPDTRLTCPLVHFLQSSFSALENVV